MNDYFEFEENQFEEINPEITEFDFEDIGEDKFESRYMTPPKIQGVPERYMKYRRAEDLAKKLKIEKGCRYFVIVGGGFIFGDLIEAIAVENNYLIKSMTISTLSMSQNNIDSLANLLNGDYLEELNIIISDYFYSHERNQLIKYMYEELDKNDRFQLAVAGTHCKTCIMETECGKSIVIHGSANLRSSANLEQIVIEENEELLKFNKEYQDSILKAYPTIKKPLRVKQLWRQVAQETKPRLGGRQVRQHPGDNRLE